MENMRTHEKGLKVLCRKATVDEWKTVLNEGHLELMKNYSDEIAGMEYGFEYHKDRSAC
ncbi:hypothetical protein BMS3Bbin06_00400 [bacterium BMS3Bbin06]|nr:hypothetical protein BMS3Abin08_00014 [bacterium BMS3Abin08]GBE33885.1 hypothetical protein BMS3Bbin06_00400 [bacterium BMS3Bbin06]